MNASTQYFQNLPLLQNTLLPYFYKSEPLKLINKQFYKLNYEKYNTYVQPHGIKITYYPKTKTLKKRKIIKFKKTYRNGKLNGLFEEYNINGQLIERNNFKNGVQDGLSETWYDDGILQTRGNYKNDLYNGLYEEWYENGQLMIKCNLRNGQKHGLCEEWWNNGKLYKKYMYTNGDIDFSLLNIEDGKTLIVKDKLLI